MDRIRPAPIPAIHPVPEYLAEGDLAAAYADMKEVLQVPWMGVVTMAYAHYREFFDVLWAGIRPLCLSAPFVTACRALRTFTEARAADLEPPPLAARLAAAGYAPREIDRIRDAIEIFSHGNFPYLLIATMTRHALEDGDLGEELEAPVFRGRHAPDVSVPLVLMEAHHADEPTRAVYARVMETLGLPFVNTDYRALARWPSYFRMAWQDLEPRVETAAYEAVVAAVHERACETVEALPNVGGLDAAAVAGAAAPDPAAVIEMCRLFQWLLPGLTTNVAFFRAQLSSDAP